MNNFQVCIIGGGPAGSAAALQLTRMGISCVLFEKDSIGGLLRQANLVENYLGFPNGVRGTKLCSLIKSQLDNNDVEYLIEEVLSIKKVDSYVINTSNRTIHADYIIIATGTVPIIPDNIPIPSELQDKVFTEVSPLFAIEGKTITIIGGGDAAFDYAINLSRTNTINIFSRSNSFKALPLLVERAFLNSNITIHTNIILTNINSLNKVFLLNCNNKDGEMNIHSDYLIFAIGRKPMLDLINCEDQLLKNDNCYLIGDACNGNSRQSAIAAGDGIRIAMHIYYTIDKDCNGNHS